MFRLVVVAMMMVACGDCDEYGCAPDDLVVCECPTAPVLGTRLCSEPESACVCDECIEGYHRPVACEVAEYQWADWEQECVDGRWTVPPMSRCINL